MNLRPPRWSGLIALLSRSPSRVPIWTRPRKVCTAQLVLNIRSNGAAPLMLLTRLAFLYTLIMRSGPTVACASLAADADAQVPATATASGVRATVSSCAASGACGTGVCVSVSRVCCVELHSSRVILHMSVVCVLFCISIWRRV